MAIYISSEFSINPNIAKKPNTVMDTSWIFGSMVYADSVDKLPTHPKLIKQGNLGSVINPNNPNTSLLYQAETNNEGKLFWKQFASPSDGSGKEIYYNPSELENLSQNEMEEMPDEITVVSTDDNVLVPTSLLQSLIDTVNNLQKEVNRIKNTFNDISAVDIEDLNSNYGSYISFIEGSQPRTEIDWTESSDNLIIRNGTSLKYGTPEGEKIQWVNEDSSLSWYEKWKDTSVEIFDSAIVNNNTYPYFVLDASGADPSTNIHSDGADEKLTLRHFAPKYAKTKKAMELFKNSLIPFELVLCLEDNALYYYYLPWNKMIMLAGGEGGGPIIIDPSKGDNDSSEGGNGDNDSSQGTNNIIFNVDTEGILNITSENEDVFVDSDGILNIQGIVDSEGFLHLSDTENNDNTSIDVDSDGNLNINSDKISVSSDGTLEINTGNIDSDGILDFDTEKSEMIYFNPESGCIEITSSDFFVDDEGCLNIPSKMFENE